MYDRQNMTAVANKVEAPRDLSQNAPSTSAPSLRPELASLLGDQQEQVEALHLTIGDLESRLAPAMVPEGPDKDGSGVPPPQTLIGQCTAQNTRGVAGATARLRSIVQRLGI